MTKRDPDRSYARRPRSPADSPEATGQRPLAPSRRSPGYGAPTRTRQAPRESVWPPPEKETDLTRPPPPVATPGELEGPAPSLFIESGPGAGRTVQLPEGELSIGRASSNKLKIGHPSVSRRHAIIARHGGRIFVSDAGSHNGTFVNGRRVSGRVELASGDEVALGLAVLVLRNGADRRASRHHSASVSVVSRRGFKLALFGGAMVLGLIIVLALAALQNLLPARRQRIEPPPAPEVRASSRPAPPRRPSVRPLRDENDRGDISLVGDDRDARPVPKPVPVAPAPPPAPAPAPKREAPRREVKAPPRPAPTRGAPARPAPARPAPAPARQQADDEPSYSASEVMDLYENGELDRAIDAAKDGGQDRLAGRIAEVKKQLATAKADISFKDSDSALKHLMAALESDEQLARGRGAVNRSIRADLSRVYYTSAVQAFDQGNTEQVARLIDRALKYDPNNQKARDFKRRLKPGAAPDVRRAADEAFAD